MLFRWIFSRLTITHARFNLLASRSASPESDTECAASATAMSMSVESTDAVMLGTEAVTPKQQQRSRSCDPELASHMSALEVSYLFPQPFLCISYVLPLSLCM